MELPYLGLDADDTLWANIDHFLEAEDRLCELLAEFGQRTEIEKRLADTEIKNVPLYGYGTKSFTLSMVEAAIEISNGRVCASVISRIHDLGRQILRHPVDLLPGVETTIPILAQRYRLIVITKGDLLEQQQKLELSGLLPYVKTTHVMSGKKKSDYQDLLGMLRIDPAAFTMVGNSLKSDVLPVLELGGRGIYFPYHYTWEHEIPSVDALANRSYTQIVRFDELLELL